MTDSINNSNDHGHVMDPSSDATDYVLITAEPLETYNPTTLVQHNSAGGISIFIGTTRDHFDDKAVISLEYECYQPMAMKEIHALCQQMRDKWSLTRIAILHRIGLVPIGSISVIIAASSEHRQAAISAVEWSITELKTRVPIWKKEIYDNNDSQWKQNAEFDAQKLVSSTASAQ